MRKTCFVLQTGAWARVFFLLSDTLLNLLLIRIRYESVRATLVAQTLLNASGCTSTTEYACSTVMVSSWHKLSHRSINLLDLEGVV